MISVGVDIGTYSIKIAEVESTSKSYVVRRIQEIPFNLSLTQDRKIEIIDALRNLFSSYDLNHTQFVFAVSQQHISTRFRHFEFRERYKILKTVPFELEEDIPFTQENAVFQAKIVRHLGKSSDVMAMASPKDHVREILNLAHDCGIEPAVISAESFALSSLLERWQDAPPEVPQVAQDLPSARPATVLLDLGHQSTKVLIYAENVLVSVRYIDWGMQTLGYALAQKYGINHVQGLKEVQAKGFILLDKSNASKDQIAFSNVLEVGMTDLVKQLKLKLLDIQAEFKLEYTQGLLVGGGSLLKNLGAFLTQQLEIPFNRYKQFEHHPTVSFETVPTMEAVTCVAVGLAIEGLRKPKNPAINFLTGEFAQQSHSMEAFWETWGYTAKVLAASFVIFFIYAVMRESASISMADLSLEALKQQAQNVAGMKGRDASPTKIRKFIDLNQKEVKNRKQAEKVLKLNSALDILTAMSQSLPAKAVEFEVRRLTVESETVDVIGAVKSAADISRIEQALKSIAVGGSIQKLPTPQGTKEVSFGYRFKAQRFSSGG